MFNVECDEAENQSTLSSTFRAMLNGRALKVLALLSFTIHHSPFNIEHSTFNISLLTLQTESPLSSDTIRALSRRSRRALSPFAP
jgi:hypothetical protein